jgi:hypothetical protein
MSYAPVRATARVVPPYLYKVVWSIALHGPVTAAGVADDHNRPKSIDTYWTPQAAANRMRSLVRLGLVERDADGFYLLTQRGRRWITNGAEGTVLTD